MLTSSLTRRALGGLVATACTASLSAFASPPTASAAPPSAPSTICDTADAIPAAALAAGFKGCDLTGRLVTNDGVGVFVPARGTGTVLTALRPNAADGYLELRHEVDGTVRAVLEDGIHDEGTEAQSAGVVTQEMVGGQAACSDITWKDQGRKESDNRQWKYNRSTHPSPGSAAATYHEQSILNGVANVVSGFNDCGLQRNFRAYNTYNGDTLQRANINDDAKCASTFPDGQNIVNWGNLNGNDTLAVACTALALRIGILGIRDEITETDIKIDTGFSWLTASPTSTCSYRFDLEAVMTHEWGHGYGLGHAEPYSEHRQQTMSPGITECSTFQRTLGRGDWTGMYNIYGLR